MSWINVLDDWLRKCLEGVCAIFFFCITILTVTLVLLRYGFNSSLIWGSEAMNYLFIYTTALGAAAAVSAGSHIKIACLRDLTRGRVRKSIDFLRFFLVGTVNAVMGWYSLPWIASAGSFESPVMRFPMWIVQSAIPVGCGLACLFCLLRMIRIIFLDDSEARSETC